VNDFHGRHVFVTGASAGIGYATARMLASRGARVFMVARGAERLEAAAREIAAGGGTVAHAVADVADREHLDAAFTLAERTFGSVDSLFANAGSGGQFAPLTTYDDATFEAVLRTNLTSVYWAMKRVLPGMIARRAGSILVTGSVASERGMPDNAAYVASKHAVLGLARAAAIENARHGVRVNCVIPGLIDTPMLLQIDPNAPPQAIRDALGRVVPLGHIGSADELAEVACFLLSDRASHVTGQAIAVDGGILGSFSPQ
jgi:NAD(P)-dependent dehydrogenase (short-subunit alcohol dehydrogenase family)